MKQKAAIDKSPTEGENDSARQTQQRNTAKAWSYCLATLLIVSAGFNIILAAGCVSLSEYNRLKDRCEECERALNRIAKDVHANAGLSPETTRENIEKQWKRLEYSGERLSDAAFRKAQQSFAPADFRVLQDYHRHAFPNDLED